MSVGAALPSQPQPLSPEALRVIETGALEDAGPEEILIWSIKNFGRHLALSASFGGPEGMVLLHMMSEIDPASRVFVIDTGRLPQETYDLIDRVRDRFDRQVEVIFPDAEAVQEMVRERGMNLFYESLENRQRCCHLRKVVPLRRYLGGLDAYVTGLRREQNANRKGTRKVEIDEANGPLVKINPIADWSHDEVWQYVRRYDVPVNRLHAKGYPSVGCAPCSRAVRSGEDIRAGRWWWESEDTKECGIHVQQEEQGSGI